MEIFIVSETGLMLDRRCRFINDCHSDDCLALGRHMTIEYYECAVKVLKEKDTTAQVLLIAAKESGATIVDTSFHQFSPQGVSGVVVIAESHFTVHTWPEHAYAAVDIFTCGDTIDFETAIASMKASFDSKKVIVSSDRNRGLLSNSHDESGIHGLKKGPDIHPTSWKNQMARKNPWGVLTSVDIYQCHAGLIRDKNEIKAFTRQLCDRIGVKGCGECQVVHVGEDEKDAGLSMVQLIGKTMVSGHFATASNTAYLNVLSCGYYDPREVAEFAVSFFKGNYYKIQTALRQ